MTVGQTNDFAADPQNKSRQQNLRSAVTPFQHPILGKSLWQLFTTIGFFLIACGGMYWSLRVSYFLTLILSVPTAALLVRVFIVQHDCGHGGFFAARWANDLVGMICSLLTLAPYANWRRQHGAHHGNWNNLDRRQSGADIYSSCTTVSEYRALSARAKFWHRFARHPIVAHLLLPPLVFLALYRVPFDTPRAWSHERWTVYATDLVLIVVFLAMGLSLGFWHVFLVQLPVAIVASIIGVWLFSVQHRFETTLWVRQAEWNFTAASIEGSSYLKLPRVLQWFTGNIGFHHIHHLDPRVPNYRLQECHEAVAAVRPKKPLTLSACFRSAGLMLWDEDKRKLVRFADAV